PIANPNARARELITHHEQRKEEIAGMIRRAPKTLAALCGELFPKMDDASLMLALSEVIGHLDLLAEEKRLAIGRKKGLLLYKVKYEHKVKPPLCACFRLFPAGKISAGAQVPARMLLHTGMGVAGSGAGSRQD